jgi:hypothetical protein
LTTKDPAIVSGSRFKTDIIVSRNISSGGFDQDFITSSSTTTQLVTVIADNKVIIAYPFTAGGAVGQYPDDFFIQWGVSLQKREAKPHPSPKGFGEGC